MEVEAVKFYYQEFHHKCVGWYVTIMGFFIAGAIAAPLPDDEYKIILGTSLLGFSILISILFFFCIFHYSKRINVLNGYLRDKLKDKPIPKDWYERSKNVFIAIRGIGSWFFFGIIISMQLCIAWLVGLKYILN